jgi:hypothetical protein
MYTCEYCTKSFLKESSLQVHMCEPKRRDQEQSERGVQLGYRAYIKFYEMQQGSAKLKTWDDFKTSPYYRAFVKWGRYCVSIRAINSEKFMLWLLTNNKKIDQWCKDSFYGDYLLDYLKTEPIDDALARALEHSLDWAEATGNPSQDYLRYGSENLICYAISTGRISPWVVYNCASGIEFLDRLNEEQVKIIWPMINSDIWANKFRDYLADKVYIEEMLKTTGW